MHEYTAIGVDRTRTIALLAVCATAIFLAIGWLIDSTRVRLPFWLSSPGALLWFALLFKAYDQYLWRISPLGFHLSKIPDLTGSWEGFITIEAGEHRAEEPEHIPCRVRFEQTWTRLRHSFETQFTNAESTSATIIISGQAWSGLHYEYETRPKPGSQYEAGMGVHHGTARLEPSGEGDWTRLTGEFFNDRNYFRFGRYDIHRQTSQPAHL